MDSASEFHDHSTLNGRIHAWFYRVNLKVFLAVATLFIPLIIIAVASFTYAAVSLKQNEPTGSVSLLGGKLIFQGDASNRLTTFPELSNLIQNSSAKLAIQDMEIVNAKINAANFSLELENYPNLHTITLDNVSILGNFSRVYLPKLKSFSFNHFIESDELSADYQQETKLKSNLFFDKTKGKAWDLIKDITNLGIDLQFSTNNEKIITVNMTKGELILNMPYCDDILRNSAYLDYFPILALSRCNVSKLSISPDLTYFNIYKVGFIDGELTDVIKTFTRLHYFLASLPNVLNVTINLSDLPKSINSVALSSVNILPNPGYASPINGSLALWGDILPIQFINSFHTVFPNLSKLAFYELNSKSHELFQNVMKTKTPSVYFQGFPRKINSMNPIEIEVEQYLISIGVPEGESDFLILLPEGSVNRIGSNVSEAQKHSFAQDFSGWYKFDLKVSC